MVLVTPASPLETVTVTPAYGGVVGLLDQVEAGGVGERVVAERLVEHVDVVEVDRVVDGLEEHRVEGQVGRPNTLSPTRLAPGATPRTRMLHGGAEPDAVAGRRCRPARPCAAIELAVEEGLAAAGRGVGAGPAEVLVVDEDVLAVGADEVGVVEVDAVGDEATFTPAPVYPRAWAVRPPDWVAAWMFSIASGSSWTLPLGAQAPGSGFRPAAALPRLCAGDGESLP